MATPKAPLASRAMIDQVMGGDDTRYNSQPVEEEDGWSSRANTTQRST
jgi:hypothetical protein